MLLFLLYTGYFTGPVQSLVNTSRLLQEGRTSFRRYRELMDTPPAVMDKPDAQVPVSVRGDLEFRGISFRYGQGNEVFRNLNLTVRAGEYVALVGASGVGKTTLCALLPRLYEPMGALCSWTERTCGIYPLKSCAEALEWCSRTCIFSPAP